MDTKKVHSNTHSSSCYFRSIAAPPEKKMFIQLTERCNLRCKHCFVSSTSTGNEIKYSNIKNILLPMFIQNNVTRVTLTGGEPFVHNDLLKVAKLFLENKMHVSICTNASLITKKFINSVSDYANLHFNVSLDGFSHTSHGRFRGNENPEFFNNILKNIVLLGENKLLNGILVTPNKYSTIQEYIQLCKFAKDNGAKYVLMNPLSSLGRGEKTIDIAFSKNEMRQLKKQTEIYSSDNFEIVYIRFPNDTKPLEQCMASKILYTFVNGDITICPYMVFAAKNHVSKYTPDQFMIGNIFDKKFNLENSLKNYNLPNESYKGACASCVYEECHGGCYAAKISKGQYLSDPDADLCPRNLDSVQ